MTAKILATLGALGIIATIWTGDWRYLATGIILLLISIGIAANADKRRKEQPAPFTYKNDNLTGALEYTNNKTGHTERIYSGYHGIDDHKPGICKCGIPLTEH